MDHAVADRVGDGAVGKVVVPAVMLELAGDDRRTVLTGTRTRGNSVKSVRMPAAFLAGYAHVVDVLGAAVVDSTV